MVGLFLYLILNLIVTLVDKPLYEVATWKDVMTYVYVIVMILLTYFHFLVGHFFYTHYKEKRFRLLEEFDGIQLSSH